MRNLAILLVLLWSTAAGAVPNTINFTGRLSTSTGAVTGSVDITLRLFPAADRGTALWSEVQRGVGADNGLVFLELGKGTTLDENVLDGRQLFLEIVIGNETLAPRLPLNSVPYAVRTEAAATADLLGGMFGASDVVTQVTGKDGVAAIKSGNGVSVGLSTAGCTNGQVYKFNGTTFACGADANNTYTGGNGITVSGTTVSLATTGCTNGQVYKFNGTSFACAADAGTNFTAGIGIDLTGGAIALNSSGCAAGSVWKFNGTTFACQPDANTTYTGGNGITVSGTTVSLATTGCTNGQVYKFNGTTFACAADANTTLSATAPLNITNGTVSISGTGCTNGQFLKWNGSAFVCSSPFTASSCTWRVVTNSAAQNFLQATCPAPKHVMSGGCDAAGAASVTDSRPGDPPADGDAASTQTAWFCEFSASTVNHTAYALCCDTI
jgi:hypothetical protein